MSIFGFTKKKDDNLSPEVKKPEISESEAISCLEKIKPPKSGLAEPLDYALFCVSEISNSDARDLTLHELSVEYINRVNTEKCEQIASCFKSNSLRDDALFRLGMKQIENYNCDEAEDIADRISSAYESAFVLALAAFKPGFDFLEYDSCKKRYRKAYDKAKSIKNLKQKAELMSEIGNYCYQFKQSKKKRYEPDTAQADYCGKLFSDAIKAAKGIKDEEQKNSALCNVAFKYYQCGMTRDEEKLLSDIVKITKKYKNRPTRLKGLAKAALQYHFSHESKEAMKILSNCLEEAQRIEDSEEREDSISTILFYYAHCKKYEKAIELVETIQDPKVKAFSFMDIANFYATDNDRNSAENYLSKAFENALTLEDKSSKDNMLVAIIEKLLEIDRFEKAQEVAGAIDNPEQKETELKKIADRRTTDSKDDQFNNLLTVLDTAQTLQDKVARAELLARTAIKISALGDKLSDEHKDKLLNIMKECVDRF